VYYYSVTRVTRGFSHYQMTPAPCIDGNTSSSKEKGFIAAPEEITI